MVAVISSLCNDTKAGGSTVTSNFGSTVIVRNKHSGNKTHKKNTKRPKWQICVLENKTITWLKQLPMHTKFKTLLPCERDSSLLREEREPLFTTA